jgi:hypothetical protein
LSSSRGRFRLVICKSEFRLAEAMAYQLEVLCGDALAAAMGRGDSSIAGCALP